jgi:hypothetical protein
MLSIRSETNSIPLRVCLIRFFVAGAECEVVHCDPCKCKAIRYHFALNGALVSKIAENIPVP